MGRILSSLPGLAAGLCAALLAGCFMQRQTTNVPVVAEAVAALRPGESTTRDVVAALGAPVEVVQLARRSAYRYEFTQRKMAGFTIIVLTLLNADLRADRVWAFFDESDVLTHVATTFEGDEARYAMPWMDVHETEPASSATGAAGTEPPGEDGSRP
jgi:hypothetical protein